MNRRLENENRRTAQVQSEYKATIKKNNIQAESLSKIGNSKAINVVIVALVTIAIILCALLVRSIIRNNSKLQNSVNNKEDSTVSILELDLSVDGEFVQGLYKNIPIDNTVNEPYSTIITKQENITENNRLAFVLNKLQENDDTADFDYSIVNAEYKKVYGTDKDAPKIDVNNEQFSIYHYNEEKEIYHRDDYKSFENMFFKYRRNIEKVEKNYESTEVYIYDNFICFDTAGGVNNFGVFATSDKAITIETGLTRGYDSGKNENIYGGKTINELFDEYNEKSGKFKHTFRLDESGNYYWYSSEYIK